MVGEAVGGIGHDLKKILKPETASRNTKKILKPRMNALRHCSKQTKTRKALSIRTHCKLANPSNVK